jgi:hypothetical protein
MQGAAAPGDTAQQATGPPSVLGVVFQNLARRNSLENLVEPDILADHLLVRVLRQPKVSCRSSPANPLQ